uniref:Lipocalin/cytosolic fatty-acid binding domain-containing protein n=1 Tax=Clastoptera arizonana TaxID=38151 RepID=A0A1B6EE81_9HEMI
MVQIKGTYKLEKNENLDNFFAEVGMPILIRKMVLVSHPLMIISEDEDGYWKITTSTLMKTTVLKFKLGEEYEEEMPNTDIVFKNVTTLSGNKLETISKNHKGKKTIRTYDFSDSGVVLTLLNHETGTIAKRYFKRVT